MLTVSEIIDTEEKEKSTAKSIEPYDMRKEGLALQEFLDRISSGEIPRDSRLLSAMMRAEVDGKVYDNVPIQVAILPNGKFKILESGTNVDLIKSQRNDNDKSTIGPIRQIREMSLTEDGRILMSNLQIQLFPDEKGHILEWRTERKKDGPMEAVFQITKDGFAILDWQEFIDTIDHFPLNFTIREVGRYTAKDVVESDAFQSYVNKLADGELPTGTAFLFRLVGIKDDKEVKIMVEARAGLPDGTLENLQEGVVTFLEQLSKQGVEIRVTPQSMKITISDIKRCPECREKFTPKRKDQVYCTSKCGNRVRGREAYRRKKALEERHTT